MNSLLAVLKSSTAVTPPRKQDKVPDQRGIADLMQLAGRLTPQPQPDPQTPRPTETRVAREKPQAVGAEQRGMADLLRLTAKLPQQPQADPQTPRPTEVRVVREKPQPVPASSGKQTLADLRVEQLQDLTRMLGAVESRLTPVQKGELARLRDTLPADKSSSAPVTSSNNPLALTQERLTPVQRGEREREIIASRTSGSTKSGGAPTSKPPVSLADGELLGQRQTRSSQSPGILDVIVSAGGGVSPTQPGTQPGATGGRPGRQLEEANPYPPASEHNVTRTHRELHEKGGIDDLGGLLGTKPEDQLNLITSVAGENSELTWAKKFNSFIDAAPLGEKGKIGLAFGTGVYEGLGNGALGMAKGLASLFQFYEDHQDRGAGATLDFLRGLTDKVPSWLDAILPSVERGKEEDRVLGEAALNIGHYLSTRGKNPSLLKKDISEFFTKNWDNLKAEHAQAHMDGPIVEAEWWGKITGRAIFETAMTVLTAADAIKLAGTIVKTGVAAFKAASEFAGARFFSSAELTSYKSGLEALNGAAERIELNGTITDSELDSLEKTLTHLNETNPQIFGIGPEAEEAADLLAKTKINVADAIESSHSVSTPNKKPRLETRDEFVARRDAILEARSYAPGNKDGFTLVENHLRNIGKFEYATLGSSNFIELEQLAKITKDTGHEYSIFEVERNGKKFQLVTRGDSEKIKYADAFIQNVKANKGKLIAHTHASGSVLDLKPSDDDIALLNELGQKDSLILNKNGQSIKFDDAGNFEKYVEITDAVKFREETAGKLTPNTTYTYKGANPSGETFTHVYKTDAKGRVVEADGNLVGKGATERATGGTGAKVGKTGIQGKPYGYNDVGFHLFGDQFLGADAGINFVAGNEALNNGPFKSLETALRKVADKPGNKVRMKIELKYNDAASNPYPNRPDQFVVKYNINGTEYTETFVNKNPEGAVRAKQPWEI